LQSSAVPQPLSYEVGAQRHARSIRLGNIQGTRLFHIASGHLSHQIEQHLLPNLPAARYPEIAPRVREHYGHVYNTESFFEQFGSVIGRIIRYTSPQPAEPAGHLMAA
jgi:fatty acid desaturase